MNHVSFLFPNFIIQPGKMWDSILEVLKEKAAWGVKVYLMYDDFGCMLTLLEKYYAQMEAEGIRCLPANKFKPVLSRILRRFTSSPVTYS